MSDKIFDIFITLIIFLVMAYFVIKYIEIVIAGGIIFMIGYIMYLGIKSITRITILMDKVE